MTAQPVDKACKPGRPTPLLVPQAKKHNARIMKAVREAREADERAAEGRRAADELREQIRKISDREERLRLRLERLEALVELGIDVNCPSNNIGRVFRLENVYGGSLEQIAEWVVNHMKWLLGPNITVRVTIPELSYDRSSKWTDWRNSTWALRPEGTRPRNRAFVAPLVKVEIVDFESASAHLLVEALTFPCLAGFHVKQLLMEAYERGCEVFGRDVELRINGLLPIAPEGWTVEAILHSATSQGRNVIEAAEAALPTEGPYFARAARNVTVEVVQ